MFSSFFPFVIPPFSNFLDGFFFEFFLDDYQRKKSVEDQNQSRQSPIKPSNGQTLFILKTALLASSLAVLISSMSSSKEGKSFKYNDARLQFHGIDDVEYVLPNDNDGKYIEECAYFYL